MNRWWKIRLTPRSPFLIAAKRIAANDYETLDYIPARVLKAAVARAIIESYGGTPEDGTPARYWVDPGLDPARCRPEWREWVRPFSDILFSDAMPFGAGRPPSTLLVCKVDPSHPPQDDLINRYTLRKTVAAPGQLPSASEDGLPGEDRRCQDCQQRLERWKSGWRLPSGGRQAGRVAHIQKRVFTRVELDLWRHTHRDERLFSVAVGIPDALVDGTPEALVFEGWIHAPEDVDLTLPPGLELRVGSNLGTGLGRMAVEIVPEPPEARKGWTEFGDWKKEVHDPSSVPLVLVTDALYGVGGKGPVASLEENLAEYARWWRGRPCAIPAPPSLTVSYASIQYESRYPFVAGQPGIRTVDPLWYWLGGSLFVFSVTDPAEEEILVQWATAIVESGVRSDVSVQGAPAWGQDEASAIPGRETTWTPVRAWSAGELQSGDPRKGVMSMDASLNQHVDWLVEEAEKFARYVVTTLKAQDGENRSGSTQDKGKQKDPAADFGKSQIENLLAAINHLASLNELKLFVHYQMGRKGSEKGWKKVGGCFLKILDEIQKKDLGEGAKTAERDPHFHLVQRFLLYWKWEHTYLTGNESGDGRAQGNHRKGGAR